MCNVQKYTGVTLHSLIDEEDLIHSSFNEQNLPIVNVPVDNAALGRALKAIGWEGAPTRPVHFIDFRLNSLLQPLFSQ